MTFGFRLSVDKAAESLRVVFFEFLANCWIRKFQLQADGELIEINLAHMNYFPFNFQRSI